MIRRRSALPRAGFTLIEIIIALALSIALMVAVYSAIDLHYRYATVGRARISHGQLFRAVTRKMSRDFTSVVMQAPETKSESGQAAGTGSSSGATGSAAGTGAASTGSSVSGNTGSASSSTGTSSGSSSTLPPPTFGVMGTATMLHLTISLPSRDLAYARPTPPSLLNTQQSNQPPQSSDLMVVSYGMAPMEHYQTFRAGNSNPPYQRPTVALGRRVVDLMASIDLDEDLLEQDVFVPEVTEVSFRYFDGATWVETWDSSVSGLLPRAIEVKFGFWSPPQVINGKMAKPMDTGSVTPVTHTFFLPASLPAEAVQ